MGTWLWFAIGLAALGLIAVSGVSAALSINQSFLALNNALATNSGAVLNDARHDLQQLQRSQPDQIQAARGLALAYGPLANSPEAVAAWQMYTDGVTDAQQWARRAERARDWPAASEWHRLLTALEPDNSQHWYALGGALREAGSPEDAQKAYETGLAVMANGTAGVGASNFLTRLGEIARQAGSPDWQLVHSTFDEAITRGDFAGTRDMALARMGRAEAADRLGLLREALQDYRWVAEQQPNNYWAHAHSGRLTWFVEGDAATAIDYLQSAVAIDAQTKWALRDLAFVYAQSGETGEAVRLFEQVLAIDPDDPLAKAQLQQLRGVDEN